MDAIFPNGKYSILSFSSVTNKGPRSFHKRRYSLSQKKNVQNILFISTWLFQLNLLVHEDTIHLRGEVN